MKLAIDELNRMAEIASDDALYYAGKGNMVLAGEYSEKARQYRAAAKTLTYWAKGTNLPDE